MEFVRAVIVGSGSSSSTPSLHCVLSRTPCATCVDALNDPQGSKNHRLNPCFLLQLRHPCDGTAHNILIDCGKTFRQSALKVLRRFAVHDLSAVLLTHGHADACYGIDDLREFLRDDAEGEGLPLYADAATHSRLQSSFPYLCSAECTVKSSQATPMREVEEEDEGHAEAATQRRGCETEGVTVVSEESKRCYCAHGVSERSTGAEKQTTRNPLCGDDDADSCSGCPSDRLRSDADKQKESVKSSQQAETTKMGCAGRTDDSRDWALSAPVASDAYAKLRRMFLRPGKTWVASLEWHIMQPYTVTLVHICARADAPQAAHLSAASSKQVASSSPGSCSSCTSSNSIPNSTHTHTRILHNGIGDTGTICSDNCSSHSRRNAGVPAGDSRCCSTATAAATRSGVPRRQAWPVVCLPVLHGVDYYSNAFLFRLDGPQDASLGGCLYGATSTNTAQTVVQTDADSMAPMSHTRGADAVAACDIKHTHVEQDGPEATDSSGSAGRMGECPAAGQASALPRMLLYISDISHADEALYARIAEAQQSLLTHRERQAHAATKTTSPTALLPLEVLVLDMLSVQSYVSHLNVDQSIAVAQRLGARRTYFVGMSHSLEHSALVTELGRRGVGHCMQPGYDGLVVAGSVVD